MDVAEAFAQGRAAYPGLNLGLESFRAFVAALSPAMPAADLELRSADLYLACACRDGIKGAPDAFEERYAGVIRRAVARVFRDQGQQEEVVQLVRQSLLVGNGPTRSPKLAQYGARGPLEGWVAVAAVRLALSYGRSLTAEKRLLERAESESTAVDPEMLVIKRQLAGEFRGAVAQALQRLSVRERLLFRLFFVSGRSIATIAKMMNVSASTAARWFSAAREAVRTDVRKQFRCQASLSSADVDSIARLVTSQVDLSISRLLTPNDTD
ncbi:MAG TPA: sigma-70 family RNA polymerase sigma factor [Polyangia bacterium]|nr:sigma-70 family RNA polymerase sigma factor [Polyangia bacterium]